MQNSRDGVEDVPQSFLNLAAVGRRHGSDQCHLVVDDCRIWKLTFRAHFNILNWNGNQRLLRLEKVDCSRL